MPVPDTAKSVGELIRERRLEREWSQDRLAGELGIKRNHLSRWENDWITPGPAYAVKLARLLGGESGEYRGSCGAPRRLRDLVGDLMARIERLERKIDG